MLPESFLHFVWRTKSFDHSNLRTTGNLPVKIIKPGIWNHNQGPDFSQATIKIGKVEWHGHVEIHVQTDDWYRHKHESDTHYNNTVLHVVHESSGNSVVRQDGTTIPEVVLADRIAPRLVEDYYRLQLSQERIPCAGSIGSVPALHIYHWIERLAIERIEQKANAIHTRMDKDLNDWPQVLWEELAAVMGGPVNSEAFREMAAVMPLKILRNYLSSQVQLEALLFGICRMLSRSKSFDDYYSVLQSEWKYLAKKHKIGKSAPFNIRFLRMRPAAFPTIRISQLAALLRQFPNLTDLLKPESFDLYLNMNITTSPYWETHYRFFEESKSKRKSLGRTQKEVILSNAILPMAWLYHRAHGRNSLDDIIENGLTRLAAEDNRHTRTFTDLQIANKHALHSQGMIQLKKFYCDKKRCLDCGIGYRILKNGG